MIITISTQKGGVGKTTTAVNLGVLLARQHRRVLLTAGRAKAHTPGAHGAFPPCVHPPSRLVLAPHRSPACSVAVAADVCNPLRSPTRASWASRFLYS